MDRIDTSKLCMEKDTIGAALAALVADFQFEESGVFEVCKS